jgi:hypothetical protein
MDIACGRMFGDRNAPLTALVRASLKSDDSIFAAAPASTLPRVVFS